MGQVCIGEDKNNGESITTNSVVSMKSTIKTRARTTSRKSYTSLATTKKVTAKIASFNDFHNGIHGSVKSVTKSSSATSKSGTKMSGPVSAPNLIAPKGKKVSQLKLEKGPQLKILVDEKRVLANISESAKLHKELAKFGTGGKNTCAPTSDTKNVNQLTGNTTAQPAKSSTKLNTIAPIQGTPGRILFASLSNDNLSHVVSSQGFSTQSSNVSDASSSTDPK